MYRGTLITLSTVTLLALYGCGGGNSSNSPISQVVVVENSEPLGLEDAINAYTNGNVPIEINNGVLSINKDLGLKLELFLEESGFEYEIQGDGTYFIKLDGYMLLNLEYIYPGESHSFVLIVTNRETGKVEKITFTIAVKAETEAPETEETATLTEEKTDNPTQTGQNTNNTQTDNAPTITLIKDQNGDSNITMIEGDTYIELGATANDIEDGNITKDIKITYLDADDKVIDPLSIGSIVGTFRVVYTIIDEGGNETEVIRYITVKGIVNTNNIPTAEDFTVDALEKNNATGDVLSYIDDIDKDPLSVSIVGNGVLSGNLTGITTSISGNKISISATGGTGSAYVDYKVSDGKGGEVTKRITFDNLNGEIANTAPTAIDGTIQGDSSSSKTFSMADFISDSEDGDSTLKIIITKAPLGGTLSIDGINLTYSMSSGNAGDDSFEFQVEDSKGLKSEVKKIDLIHFDNF